MHVVLQSTIVLQIIHHGMSQIMPGMQFPPMPFGMPAPPEAGAMPPMPMPMMPGPMPLPMGMPQPKLPIVVMPYYSKRDKKQRRRRIKKRPRKKYSSESSCDSNSFESSSDVEFRASSKARGRRRQVLTPVVSYVTKEGYVVYQKKIRKDKAKDWLRMGKDKSMEVVDDGDDDGIDVQRRFSKKHRH